MSPAPHAPSVLPHSSSGGPWYAAALGAAALLLSACAEGGKEERPQSEVQIAANHHLFWFRALPEFAAFPVAATEVFAGEAVMRLENDSTYALTLPNGQQTAPDSYSLETSGALSIRVSGNGREPSTVFLGGYGLVADQTDVYFTDRVSAYSSPSIGLYFGTRVIPGQVELEGDWHLASLHAIFASNQGAIPRNVGRAAFGAVSIAAGDPGTERALTGSGSESGSDPNPVQVTFAGTAQNLLQNGAGDGSLNLTVEAITQATSNPRVYRAAAGRDIVLAVDQDGTDGDSGLLLLVRQFDAPATVADPSRVAGEFLIGGQTLFVNPANSGADAFVGVLTLTEQGGWQLTAEGYQGIDFSYSGNYTLADDGGLTLEVSGATDETWFAAITPSYDTLVLVDAVVESRQNNLPELNLAIGVRRVD